jgi:hypothetical protein
MHGGSIDTRDDLLTLKVTELKVSLPNLDSSLLAEPLLVEPQERLKAAGLPVSGKKDVLVDRLLASIIVDEHEQVHGDSKPEVQKEEEPGEKDVEVEAVVVQEVEEMVKTAIQAVEVAARPREEEMEVEMERPAKRVRIEEALVPEEVKIEPKVEDIKLDVVVPKVEEIKVEEKIEIEQTMKEEEAAEEQEPPEYHFEPEVLDLSSSDMYLDTVSFRHPSFVAFELIASILDKSISTRFRFRATVFRHSESE